MVFIQQFTLSQKLNYRRLYGCGQKFPVSIQTIVKFYFYYFKRYYSKTLQLTNFKVLSLVLFIWRPSCTHLASYKSNSFGLVEFQSSCQTFLSQKPSLMNKKPFKFPWTKPHNVITSISSAILLLPFQFTQTRTLLVHAIPFYPVLPCVYACPRARDAFFPRTLCATVKAHASQ